MSRRPILAACLLLLAAVVLPARVPTVAAGERCYRDWSDAAPIVVREQLRSARDVQDMARIELGGDVVRIVLCEADGGFIYRLVLRRLDGRIGTLTVSAARDGEPEQTQVTPNILTRDNAAIPGYDSSRDQAGAR